MTVRLFYLDDSGAESTGYVVYSWVEVEIHDWRSTLHTWLEWRRVLSRNFQIPVQGELHATEFVGGRGSPSLDEKWNHSKVNRRRVAAETLRLVGSLEHLQVGTVYRRTAARRRAYHAERISVYRELVNLLDARLTAAGELGILLMDGDGSDVGYYSAHRSLRLATRAIIEDPLFQHSSRSQWMQIADLVAYSAYQHLLRHPGKEFAWSWYPTHLRARDEIGGPVPV